MLQPPLPGVSCPESAETEVPGRIFVGSAAAFEPYTPLNLFRRTRKGDSRSLVEESCRARAKPRSESGGFHRCICTTPLFHFLISPPGCFGSFSGVFRFFSLSAARGDRVRALCLLQANRAYSWRVQPRNENPTILDEPSRKYFQTKPTQIPQRRTQQDGVSSGRVRASLLNGDLRTEKCAPKSIIFCSSWPWPSADLALNSGDWTTTCA